MRIRLIGVHPVAAEELCHLIELTVLDGEPVEAIESITQEIAGQPRADWQVPYDEAYLTADGERVEQDRSEPTARVAFFFHYLDPNLPLLTAAGPLSLPRPSPRPARLDFMQYEPPC